MLRFGRRGVLLALDLQTVLGSINGAKELISGVMEELRKQKEAEQK